MKISFSYPLALFTTWLAANILFLLFTVMGRKFTKLNMV
jgi:hypothetical protein